MHTAGLSFLRGVDHINLYACVSIRYTEEHPRDRLWFDLFATQVSRDAFVQRTTPETIYPEVEALYPMSLSLESVFVSAAAEKAPSLAHMPMEAWLVSSLRTKAKDKSPALGHAYRCLATCLENYARYGDLHAVTRVTSLADKIGRAHV